MRDQAKKLKLRDGSELTLYSTGFVAERLGRCPNTIRKWDLTGTIPPTPFSGKFGDRLYTEDHINALVNAARISQISAGRFSSRKRIRFTELLQPEFDRIKEKYRKLV